MSTPTTPFYPMTHDDALDLIDAVKGIAVPDYDFSNYLNIVAAIRSGNADKVPNGTVFKVTHAVYGDIYFVTRARNQHKVYGDATRPTITIQALYLLSSGGGTTAASFQYDRPEAFYSVDEAIAANTVCKFATIAYGGWAAGTYHFTPTAQIPAGAKLCISGYQNTALTSLKVQVFDNAKATSASAEYAISSGDGGATKNLGTWGTECNHPQRVSYGSNNDKESNLFQWLNAIGTMSDVWTPQTKFDMLGTGYPSMAGFLGGFPEAFRGCLGLCAIPNLTNGVYETAPAVINQTVSYNGYFFLPSRKEIYGSNENSYEAGEVQFDYYKDIATDNADKLMYAKGAASPATYWLRTPNAGNANNVRICYTGSGGGLNNNNANNSNAAAPIGGRARFE